MRKEEMMIKGFDTAIHSEPRKRMIPERTTVILSSDVYGEEEFKYDTDEDLLAGVTRLYSECKKGSRKDGMEREIRIRINSQR